MRFCVSLIVEEIEVSRLSTGTSINMNEQGSIIQNGAKQLANHEFPNVCLSDVFISTTDIVEVELAKVGIF